MLFHLSILYFRQICHMIGIQAGSIPLIINKWRVPCKCSPAEIAVLLRDLIFSWHCCFWHERYGFSRRCHKILQKKNVMLSKNIKRLSWWHVAACRSWVPGTLKRAPAVPAARSFHWKASPLQQDIENHGKRGKTVTKPWTIWIWLKPWNQMKAKYRRSILRRNLPWSVLPGALPNHKPTKVSIKWEQSQRENDQSDDQRVLIKVGQLSHHVAPCRTILVFNLR